MITIIREAIRDNNNVIFQKCRLRKKEKRRKKKKW